MPWCEKPDRAAHVGAYMCLSRVRCIDDVWITQPYSPILFNQGDLPGPELLLKFQRGELRAENLEEEWRGRREPRSRRSHQWLEGMPLYCRGCSERAGEDVQKPAKEFPHTSTQRLWQEVVALGMHRFCTACIQKRRPETAKPQKKTEQSSLCMWCNAKAPVANAAIMPIQLCPDRSKVRVKCVKCVRKGSESSAKAVQAFS